MMKEIVSVNIDSFQVHCWNYRNFIIDLLSLEAKKNLEFIQSKIESNPSNYSAWHNRSYLVKDKKEEIELVKNAFFTIPNDQSAWIYHRWLNLDENDVIQTCQDLLEIEPDCKWAILTILVHKKDKFFENVKKLIELDINHKGYYLDLQSDFIIKSNESLNLIGKGLTRMNAIYDLKEINLSNNSIKMIPKLKLKNLEILILDENEIEFIENLEEMKELKILSIKKNKVESLNEQFLLNSSLETLDISGNPLITEKTKLLLAFPNLKNLNQ